MGLRNRMRVRPVSRAVIDHFNKNLGVVTRTVEDRFGLSVTTGYPGCFTWPEWFIRSGARDAKERQELRDAQFEMRRNGGTQSDDLAAAA